MQAFLAVDAVRLMNQAQHRLNAGVINQHQYDELMRDLQRLQAAMPPQAMMLAGMMEPEPQDTVQLEQSNPDQVPFGVDNTKHFPALQEVQRSPDRDETGTPPHQARLLSGIELPNLHAPPVPSGPPAIPPHKRIYVDGRAYEVQYFKDDRGRDVGVIGTYALKTY